MLACHRARILITYLLQGIHEHVNSIISLLSLLSFSHTYCLSRYSQITSQLGDVLDFPFPGVFGEIVEALQPIMDFWTILFRALGPSECFGLRGFSARWMLRVVVFPGILLVIVLFAFLYDRKTHGPAEANLRVKSNLFFVLFFTYPSICSYSGNNMSHEISRIGGLPGPTTPRFLLTGAVLPPFCRHRFIRGFYM